MTQQLDIVNLLMYNIRMGVVLPHVSLSF